MTGSAYVGKVGTGFSAATRKELLDAPRSPGSKDHPVLRHRSPAPKPALAHFVRPEIVGEVQFAEWTNDGHLRQPSWRGLRSRQERKGGRP